MKMFKNFFSEVSQVTWIGGRQLVVDTGYVLLFSAILLVYFTVVDGLLAKILERISQQ